MPNMIARFETAAAWHAAIAAAVIAGITFKATEECSGNFPFTIEYTGGF